VDGLDACQLALALSRWPHQAGAAAGAVRDVAHWAGVTPSLGVILLDLTLLRDASAEVPAAVLQPLDLEQLHALLGSILQARKVVSRLAQTEPPKQAPSSTRLTTLTRRQHDILREAARGKSNVEIAQALHISVDTVKSHMRQILRRVEARNRTELAAMYQQAVNSIRARGTN